MLKPRAGMLHLRYAMVTRLLVLGGSPGSGVAQSDTVRVGRYALRTIAPGTDTSDVFTTTNGTRSPTRLSLMERALETYQGRPVLRITSEDGRTRTLARVDPVTLQTVTFERVTPVDSTRFALETGCVNG